MSLTWPALLLWQYGLPLGKVLALDLLLSIVHNETSLHSYFWCMVAVEEGRVDLHSLDPTRCDAKSEDYPVEKLRIVPSRLPAVIPCSCIREDARFANWGSWRRKILCGCEPFVGTGEYARAKWFANEVFYC